jgi:erythromycin esterase
VELVIPENTVNLTIGVVLVGGGTVWYDNFAVEADGVPLPQGDAPFIGEPTAQQVEWIREQAKPVTGAALQAIVGNARVVSLGENTYGSSEAKRTKIQLIEHLAAEGGFTLLGLEANMPETEALNEYVATGEGDLTAILGKLYYWFYSTVEFRELVEAVRRSNASGRTKLRFCGYDMQWPVNAGAIVRKFVEERDPAYLATLDPIYEEMRILDELPVTNANRARFQRSVEDTAKVRAYLEEKFPGRSDAWPVQNARIVEQAQASRVAPTGFYREEMMARNALWFLDQYPGERMVAWTLNLHSTRLGSWQGAWMNRALGSAYVAIGFAFHQGRYAAVDREYNPLPSNEAAPSFTGSAEYVFEQTGAERFLLDLRTAAAPESAGSWLRRDIEFRELAEFVQDGFSVRRTLATDYDALIWIREVTPSTPLP